MSKYNLNKPWEQITTQIEIVANDKKMYAASSLVVNAVRGAFNALPQPLYSDVVIDGIIDIAFKATRTGYDARRLERSEAEQGISTTQREISGLRFTKAGENDEQKAQELQQQIDAKETDRCGYVAKINLGINVDVEKDITRKCKEYVDSIIVRHEAAKLADENAALTITAAAASAEANSPSSDHNTNR